MTDQRYHSHVRSEVFPLFQPGGKLLDFGGGNGATAAAIKAGGLAERVGLVDLVAPADPDSIDFAFQGDLNDSQFLERIAREEGPFDTILCLDVLEHFVDPWAMVAQLDAMLVPGGVLVASLPNVRHYSALLPLLLRGRWQYREAGILDRTHLRFFTRESAGQLMTSSGLTLEVLMPRRPLARRNRWAIAASLGLLTDFIALQYLVRVRKPH